MLNQRIRGANAVLLAVALATSGCGGGGGSGSNGGSPSPSQPDTTAPDTKITSSPAAISNSSTASFNVTSSESGSTFEASLDSAAFAVVTLPLQLSNLADGNHTLSIRARDTAGNVDASPATFTWTIDTGAPSAKIVFPLPHAYTDASTLTVRGVASDTNGIASVQVNGVAAASSDNFATWSAVVPILQGPNGLTVSITDGAGNTNTNAASVLVFNRGPVVAWSSGIAYNAISNQIVVSNSADQSLDLFELPTGFGTSLVANSATSQFGSGPFVLDEANHRALVVDTSRNTLDAVDLSTGQTHNVSPSDTTHSFISASSITLDAAHNAVFIATIDEVMQVDLDSGARSLVSGGLSWPPLGLTPRGNGPAFNNAPLLALDNTNPASPRLVGAVVFDINLPSGSVVAVDVATGDRQVISPTDPNSAPLVKPVSVAIDPSTHRLLVSDAGTKSLLSVDLTTGNRSVVSSASAGQDFTPTSGLTLGPNGTVFVAQELGAVASVNLSSGARQLVIHSNVGQGPRFGPLSSVVIERSVAGDPLSPPRSLLVVEEGRLSRVDLSTGDRRIVSSADVGSGPFGTGFTSITLDTRATSEHAMAFGIVAGSSELVSVDLTNGSRTHVGDLGFAGMPCVQVDLHLDAQKNRLYFTNVDNDLNAPNPGLYSYDLTANQRTTLADNSVGSGPLLHNPTNLLLDTTGNRIIVSDWSASRLVSVDLQTGARSYFASDPGAYLRPGPLYLDTAHSRLIGMKGAPYLPGLIEQQALAALQARHFDINEAAVFTMMLMIQTGPIAFSDSTGTTWIGGADHYDGTKAQRIAFTTQYGLPEGTGFQQLASLDMPVPSAVTILSGPETNLSTVRGNGPQQMLAFGLDVDPTAGIAYLAQYETNAIMAIDLVSGDRILISH